MEFLKEVSYSDIIITKEEIEEVKKEFLQSHKYFGTNKPVILDDRTAEYVLRGRKYHEQWKNNIHPTHKMGEWYTDIRCPASTERFYSCRECLKCGYEQMYHAAGKFKDSELLRECIGVEKEEN